MNYRHAFHAGNFADVFKHALLARILTYLNSKDAPYLYLDTHAGIGVYNLQSSEATRTGEWQDGIARLEAAKIAPVLADLLSPYRLAIQDLRQNGEMLYPGSPRIAQTLSRQQDRLAFCELHPDDASALARNCASDPRCKITSIDGFMALKAWLPPKERRGLVLIDPPFEQVTEFADIVSALVTGHRKWATGIFAIWYPLKGMRKANDFVDRLKTSAIPKILRLELCVDDPDNALLLGGCGLIVINPPWTLKREAELLLPLLADLLGRDGKGSWRADWLSPE